MYESPTPGSGERPDDQPAPATPTPEPPVSLVERFSDVFVAPGRAMAATARRPAWWLPALVVFTIMFLYTAINAHLLMPAQSEMQLEHATGEQREMIEQQLEMFQDPPTWLRVVAGLGAGFGVTILGGLVFALVCHLFLRLSEGQGRVGQTVAVVFWAGLIVYGLKTLLSWIVLTLGGGVRLATLNAAALIPDADPQGLPFQLASMFGDPFVWWMLGVVMIGITYAHRLPLARSATVVAATYVLLTAVMIGFSLIGKVLSGA